MSKQLNYKLTLYLKFLGVVSTTFQLVQFFNGLWTFDTKVEIFMLIFSVALFLNPSKYFDKLFDAILERIKGNKTNDSTNYNDFDKFSDTGGSSIPPENEEEV